MAKKYNAHIEPTFYKLGILPLPSLTNFFGDPVYEEVYSGHVSHIFQQYLGYGTVRWGEGVEPACGLAK